MTHLRSIAHISAVLATLLLMSCADSSKEDAPDGNAGRVEKRGDVQSHQSARAGDDNYRARYFERHGYMRLTIPVHHYPPPGQCRVWHPDRLDEHQHPATDCLNAPAPPGAWLLRRPADRPDHVLVEVYEPAAAVLAHASTSKPVLMVVGEFDIETGSFIRIVTSPGPPPRAIQP